MTEPPSAGRRSGAAEGLQAEAQDRPFQHLQPPQREQVAQFLRRDRSRDTVVRGRARITIGDVVHDVGPDDTLYIPAGVPHSYDVVEGPFEFLCVVPNAPDQIRLLENC